MDPVFEMQVVYPYAPDLVWEAITDKGELDQWLMETHFEPTVGFVFRFQTPPNPHWRGWVEGTVLEADPPTRLAYSWSGDDEQPASTVTWTLGQVDGGTKLSMEHRGFVGERGLKAYNGMKSGWTEKMNNGIPASIERLIARGK